MNAVAKITNPLVVLPKSSSGTVSPLTGIPVGYGPGGPLPTPTPWIQYGNYVQWTGGVVVGNPTGGALGPGSINALSYFVNGQPFDLGNYMPLTGGVFGGLVTFQGGVDGITLDEGTF